MKKAHKALVDRATKLRKSIRDKTLDAAEHQAAADTALEEVTALQSDLSQVEAEAAADGLSTSELHAAVKL